jgi:hypothetical protein
MKTFCLGFPIIPILFLFLSSNTFAQLPSDPGNDPMFQSQVIKSSESNSSQQIDEMVQKENNALPEVKKLSADSPKQKKGLRQKSKQKSDKRKL